MAYEAFNWPEGSISLWTGAASPSTSAVVAYAQNMQVQMAYGWLEHESVDGVYARHLTGQSVDATFGAIYTYDSTLLKMIASATALHMKIAQTNVNGSAGLNLYSGNISGLTLIGDENNPHVCTFSYHGNLWSGYGG